MAIRSSQLHATRSDYLRDLTDDDASGLANGPFADAGPPLSSLVGPSASSAPPSTPGTSATALYLQETGDTSVISVNDINQGQLGDCFLLSSIGEIALWHPGAIMNMINSNADGTETVTLYLAASGQLPTYGTTSFKSTTVTIDNTFPSNAVNNGATQDVVNGVKEIWVQVLEKAVATLDGGYNAIANGGSPMIAMEELAGQQTTWMSPSSLTLQALQADAAAGDLIVMDTPSTGVLPYNLVNDHAYMFESVNVVNGTPMVQLGNPWGFDQPQAIPLAQLSSGVIEVDIGQFVDSNLITGGPGNDNKVLASPVTNASVDLGAGEDTLTFADGTNSATVANTETIIGGTGDDTVVLATATNNASIDLGAGNDSLTFGNFTNSASVANVETVTGGSGNDTITLGSPITPTMSVDLGAGANKLTLAAGGNTGTISNVSTLIGGSGPDAITLTAALVSGSVDLGAGNDTLALANGTNSATVSNVETLTGGAGNDSITLGAAAVNASIDLGAGNNILTFGGFTNSATVNNVQTIIGGSGNDAVALASVLTAGMKIDLGSGSNSLSLANGANTGTIDNVGTLVGGSGADTITFGAAAQNASIDLGAGNDRLIFGNFTNTATVANVETLTGGTGNDTVTLTTPLTNSISVDLGAGSNKLTLANGGNTGTLNHVGTLVGGTGNDTITLGGPLVNGSVDLGGGSDTLTLANFTNRISVANTESVFGGSGNDTIILTGSAAESVIGGGGMNFITGNSAADQFVFDQNSYGDITWVTNFSAAKGDKIALDTTGHGTFLNDTYDLGGAALTLGTDLGDVANWAARIGTTLNNGGKGAFLYEQDTGELFYSANGSFVGGSGTQIGIITSNGSTPWTFDANSFVQV
jgi:Ca2+-binding RTX toxin-like protein